MKRAFAVAAILAIGAIGAPIAITPASHDFGKGRFERLMVQPAGNPIGERDVKRDVLPIEVPEVLLRQ